MATHVNGNNGNGQTKITAVRRIIAHMSRDELNATELYIKERRTRLYRKERELKLAAGYEKIKSLGIGAELRVWAMTASRDFIQRGDILTIDAFSPRGRKCAYLKLEKNGKVYRFSPENLENYDVRPGNDGDPIGQPIGRGFLAI